MRGVVAVIMLCAVQFLSAQIRIISQERLLEVANPKSVASPLRFATEEVNFGTIDEMSGVWQGRAEIVNTGGDTVAVTQVKSTCGCLQVALPKRVLAPKERVEVALKYYPRGHAGRVMQRVLLYTNASQEYPSAILQLRGIVLASADRSDDYPYTRGVLRLRQDTVRLSGDREVQRIAIMNGGSTALSVAVDTLFTPRCLKVRFEPSTLAPKQEGYMVVSYEPNGGAEAVLPLKIHLKIPGVTPRNGVVGVRICENE